MSKGQRHKDGIATFMLPINFGKNFPKEDTFSYAQLEELHQILAATVKLRTMSLVSRQRSRCRQRSALRLEVFTG